MMYKIPFKTFVEKVPFLEYIARIVAYIVKPDIKEDALDNNPLRYALTDIFLSVGFISAITAYLIIFRPKYKYLSFIKAINPEPIIINFLLGGIVTSSVFCLAAMLLVRFRNRIAGDVLKKQSYYIWLHSLRFYAVLTVFIFSVFIHASGLAVNDGKLLKDHISEHLIDYWIVLLVMIALIFRLFINPVVRYLSIFRSKCLSSIVFLIIFVISVAANRSWSSIDFGELINEEKCRQVFRQTDIYSRFPSDKIQEAEDLLCNKKGHITK